MAKGNVKTIQELHDLFDPIFKKYHIKEVWLFGSYSKGTQTASSDVDFVYSLDGLDVEDMLDFSEEMFKVSNEHFYDSCDLIDIDTLKESSVEKHKQILASIQPFYRGE